MTRRVAFVGQRTYFEACAQPFAAGGLEPRFVDFRGGGDADALLGALRALRPHVVVVFRPEIVPAGLFAELPARTLGFNTEPLPREGAPRHPDLEWRLSELALLDPSNYDRLITFDPLSAAAAARVMPVWRALPLPVDDRFFAPVRRVGAGAKVLFVGYSTEHRERFLTEVKHYHDVLHVAHGVHGEELRALFARAEVAINLHGEPYPTFENRVCLHLAAGHLVVSEPLSPAHGLEPGLDFVEISSPWELSAVVGALRAEPGGRLAVRARGRRKAELFRASRVWPRVLFDLERDVAAFGSQRTARAVSTSSYSGSSGPSSVSCAARP